MKLKKVLSVVLASIMVLGLAACGNKESADSEKEGGKDKEEYDIVYLSPSTESEY